MGYETKLFIVRMYHDNTGSEVATIDLSDAGSTTHTGELLAACRTGTAFRKVYTPGRNDAIENDDCAAQLTAVPRDELMKALIKDLRGHAKYRRFVIASQLLAMFDDPAWDDEHIEVVQYGH